MLSKIHIATFDRIVVNVIKFLPHHFSAIDQLRMRPFLPKLVNAIGLVR